MLMLGLQLQLNQLNVWANYGYVDTNDYSAKLFGEHLWLSNMSCWDIKIKIMVMSLLALYQMCLHLFSGDCEYCVRPTVWHCHLPQAECQSQNCDQGWNGRNDQTMRSYCKLNIILYFSHTGVCQHKCFKCFLCHSSSIKTVNLRFLIIIMDHVIALKDHSSLNKRHQKLWKIFNNKK